MYSTVLSCPARLCKAWLFEVWSGLSVWSPVLLGQVLLGSAGQGAIEVRRRMVLYGPAKRDALRQAISWRGKVLSGRVQHSEVLYCRVKRSSVGLGKVFHGLVRSCCAAWGSVERCFVLYGKVLSWQGGLEQREVQYGKVLLRRGIVWSSDVLFGVAGFIGALYSKVRSYCGVVWNREALHRMVKFCPAKYCYARYAKASLRLGGVKFGFVEPCWASFGVIRSS